MELVTFVEFRPNFRAFRSFRCYEAEAYIYYWKQVWIITHTWNPLSFKSNFSGARRRGWSQSCSLFCACLMLSLAYKFTKGSEICHIFHGLLVEVIRRSVVTSTGENEPWYELDCIPKHFKTDLNLDAICCGELPKPRSNQKRCHSSWT